LSRAQSKGKRGTSLPAVNQRKTARKEENKRAKGVEDEGEDNAQLKVDELQTQLADDDNGYGKETGHFHKHHMGILPLGVDSVLDIHCVAGFGQSNVTPQYLLLYGHQSASGQFPM